jgi:serine protease Do
MFRILIGLVMICFLSTFPKAGAEESFAKVAEKVNSRLVKLFGSGGYQGLASYGTGALVSPDGYILTVSSHILDTTDLLVHLADGRRFKCKVVATEPNLDVALLRIDSKDLKDLDFFDFAAAAEKKAVDTGTGILAFSNQFKIAEREEPMSVQRGVIAGYAKLPLRRGINEAPFSGEVYVIDAITNNPGAGGGVITTRKGELLGLIGKELRNNLTDTWINYAVPIQATAKGKRDDKEATVSIAELVELKEKYNPLRPPSKNTGPGGYSGIVLVPNVVERTPPYIEDIAKGSPAERAGLKPDDLIVYVDGEQVGNINNYRDIVDKAAPGTEFKIEVRRGDRLQSFSVKLEKMPGKTK